MVKEVILNKQLKAGACYSTAMPPVAAGSGDLLFSNCFVAAAAETGAHCVASRRRPIQPRRCDKDAAPPPPPAAR